MTVWEDRQRGDDVPPWRRTAAAASVGVADVVDGLRNVATLKGVLPFGSIDPRAIDHGQPVRVLSRGAYDGQQVLYRHTPGRPPWLCIWDRELNGGAGAWFVHGAAPIQSVQTSSGTRTTNGAVPNLPALSIPVGGLWVIEAFGSVRQSASAALQDCEIRVTVNGSAVPSNIVSVTQSAVWVGGLVHGREGASGRVLSAGDAIGLTVAAALNGTVTWIFGDKRVWHILATPLELRP